MFLNSPLYRRDLHHGLRFWEATEHGSNVDVPREILNLNLNEIQDSDGWSPYGDLIDGHASQRAADFIVGLLSS